MGDQAMMQKAGAIAQSIAESYSSGTRDASGDGDGDGVQSIAGTLGAGTFSSQNWRRAPAIDLAIAIFLMLYVPVISPTTRAHKYVR